MIKTSVELRETSVIQDIMCDKCNISCKKQMNIECAEITASWGFESKQDGAEYNLHLCEQCFNNFMAWIKQVGL